MQTTVSDVDDLPDRRPAHWESQSPPDIMGRDVVIESKAVTILVTSYLFTSLAALFVAGRMFSRYRKLGRLAPDDYLILLSLAIVVTSVGLLTAAVLYGYGSHAGTLSIPDLERAQFLWAMSLAIGSLGTVFPKLAVVSLLSQVLFPSPRQLRVLWGLAVACLLSNTAVITLHFAQCKPASAFWTVDAEAKCWDPIYATVTAFSSSAFLAIVDFYLALYPAAVLWSLEMHLRKKLALSVALSFGICAGVVATYKCVTLPGLLSKVDRTFATADVAIWQLTEANSVIIAACIPMLLPLVELWFGKDLLAGGQRTLRRVDITLDRMEEVCNKAPDGGQQTELLQRQSLESILLLERPSVDEEHGRRWQAVTARIQNIRQRQQRPS
ncbi:hypothetical protein FOTG_17490 [Fusarium oxysporum f. sp. vasinfectum 25433]|uniref:Rhodopsin domain-containing protein n=1 Tax=Fusarium oxysporum f. sp. vasinfectum 25433 TaxID=1089449 RepID=X0M054_FUSOX|nr:hypothetical protein FOTG_17490 [Fusarium oxysporum f. sp. vasinfectum 25433]